MRFLRDYFLFRVDDEKKQAIRKSVMSEDYSANRAALLVVSAFQIVMLIFSMIDKGIDFTKYYIVGYQALYAFLAAYCLIARWLLRVIRSAGRMMPYFVVVSLSEVFILLWGAAISVLDCGHGPNLTVFAFVAVALSGGIILEPWVVTINLSLTTIAMNIAILLVPASRALWRSSIVINSVSVFGISVLMSCFSFYRHIRRINMGFEIQKLNETLACLAVRDELTGLYNRRFLTEHIDTPMNIGTHPSAVIMADIDHFKQLNDCYGHQAGDECLRTIGSVLCSHPELNADYGVRYGGEEFMLYFSHETQQSLMNKAELLRRTIAETAIDAGASGMLHVTISVGAALSETGLSYSGLISRADKALYDAKLERDKSVFYTA